MATTLREELDRLERGYADVPVKVSWDGGEVPHKIDGLAQSVLGESLRNAIRHAQPSEIDIHVNVSDETFSLEILNDGVNGRSSGTGMGLRLASLEALQIGGVVEFGSADAGRWRTRLVVPL
jgi:signal transduction histidine kinase